MAIKKPAKKPPEPETVQLNLRVPPDLIQAIDAWVFEENQAVTWPKMTRSDLIRGVMEWAARARPDWKGGADGSK